MGEILGWYQKDKTWLFSIFLNKIICCGCVLESPRRGDSYTHPRHIIYRDFMIIEIKTLAFSENFMSTETFT